MTTKACIGCNNIFIPRSNNQKWCSERCRQQQLHPNKRVIKACQHCMQLFQMLAGNQIFCSKKCKWQAHVPSELTTKNKKIAFRTKNLKLRGLTPHDYELELQNQNYVCAICYQPETASRNGLLKRLAVDHNHLTNGYRGLLCQNCNTGLGQFQDNIAILKQAIQYLERHKDPRDNT
jgi:hypothetical protein